MTFAGLTGEDTLVRVWSDGVAEYRILHSAGGHVWVELPINPAAPLSNPVAVTAAVNGHLWRQWADGTVDHIQVIFNCGGKEGCTVNILEDWANLPEPP